MSASQTWLDTVTHNLANASTTGYKRDEIAFEESLIREMRDASGNGRIIGDLQNGPDVLATRTVYDRGALQTTGNPLDVAIQSESGMFAIQTPVGVAFTRAGNFTLDADRQLVDSSGRPVLDRDYRPIRVEAQGAVSISPQGDVLVEGQTTARLGVFEGEFQKIGGNLFRSSGEAEAMTAPMLATGSIESSNVNAVASMIEMVQVQRLFELAQRGVLNHDEATSRLIQAAQPR